jgi:hypothetical protein
MNCFYSELKFLDIQCCLVERTASTVQFLRQSTAGWWVLDVVKCELYVGLGKGNT